MNPSLFNIENTAVMVETRASARKIPSKPAPDRDPDLDRNRRSQSTESTDSHPAHHEEPDNTNENHTDIDPNSSSDSYLRTLGDYQELLHLRRERANYHTALTILEETFGMTKEDVIRLDLKSKKHEAMGLDSTAAFRSALVEMKGRQYAEFEVHACILVMVAVLVFAVVVGVVSGVFQGFVFRMRPV